MNSIFILIIILTSTIYLVSATYSLNNNEETTPATNIFSTSIFNQTEDEILEQKLGPRRKSLLFTVFMSVAYGLIFICGICGNLCICCVIIYNTCMHTTTNYYLFALAVSDLLLVLFGKYILYFKS